MSDEQKTPRWLVEGDYMSSVIEARTAEEAAENFDKDGRVKVSPVGEPESYYVDRKTTVRKVGS